MGEITATYLIPVGSSEYSVWEQRYSSLKTDEQRVKLALCLMHEKKMLSSLSEPSTKSNTVSRDYQKEGTKIYVNRSSAAKLDTTIELYTKSIVFAPPESRELALGYANRSAALFTARLYQDCLQDISRALALPYPDDLKAKLYARRATCLMTVKSPTKDQEKELKETLKMAAEYVDKMAANGTGRKKIEEMLREPKKMIPVEGEFKKWQNQAMMPKISHENPEIKGVSSALNLEFNDKFGRHTVATRNINPGEVLAVLKPYAGILNPEQRFTHCAYCMEQTWSSVPCEGCCEVVYCNENCKNKAYNEYHDVECQVSRHVIALVKDRKSTDGLLSLRLLVKALKETGSIEALREKVKDIEDQEGARTIGCTRRLLDDRDYHKIYTLIRNTEKMPIIDLIQMSFYSSYILLALATKSDLFAKTFEGRFDELQRDADVTFVGGLIMRHLQIIDSNAGYLYEEGPSTVLLQKGVFVMPFSQMNHSCNPWIVKVFYGMNVVFYANYAMKKGEQVFDNYGQHYGYIPRSERQKRLLKAYYFSCNCIPCIEDWPLYPNAKSSLACLPHQTQQRLTQVLKNIPKYRVLVANKDMTGATAAIADMNDMVKFLQENANLPCIELNAIVELREKLFRLTGSRFQTVNLSDCSSHSK